MNKDLFLAILAMDSYDRGYEPNVKMPTGGSRIGQSLILADSEERAEIIGGKAAGFYAAAYDWGGETIISYRGSDNIKLGAAFINFITGGLLGNVDGDDVSNGYGVAFGVPDGPQATLAIEFYKAVAKSIGSSALNEANITLTGHSLGGGRLTA